jgi:hypothetical protein
VAGSLGSFQLSRKRQSSIAPHGIGLSYPFSGPRPAAVGEGEHIWRRVTRRRPGAVPVLLDTVSSLHLKSFSRLLTGGSAIATMMGFLPVGLSDIILLCLCTSIKMASAASSCGPQVLSLPIQDVQVIPSIPDSFMRGIPLRAGTPAQDLVVLPWA